MSHFNPFAPESTAEPRTAFGEPSVDQARVGQPSVNQPSVDDPKVSVTCQHCGRKLRAKRSRLGGRAKCPACGEVTAIVASPVADGSPTPPPLAPPTLEATSMPQAPAERTGMPDPNKSGILFPLYFPATIPGAFGRLWWVALLGFVPVLNLLLLRGWRLEVASRVAHGEDNPLPEASGILKYVTNGCVLWFFTLAYTLVPPLLIVSLGIGGWWDTVCDIVTLVKILIGQSDESLWAFLVNEGMETLACMAIVFVWGIVSIPLYRAAVIRYSVSGNLAAFWNLPASCRFLFSRPWSFTKMYLTSALTWAVVGSVASAIAATGVGALAVFLVVPAMYFWSSGYEYGRLGATLLGDGEPQRAPVEPVTPVESREWIPCAVGAAAYPK
ncbi:MAG: DUF4013 domain-containing protein [Planctomycetota bacterium]